jgi:hypothetical protein
MVADTVRAGIATAQTADAATAEETLAPTDEDLVANSPGRPPEVEDLKVDFQDTVVATATAGLALDLASPTSPGPIGLAITGPIPTIMATGRRITHLCTTLRW